MKNSPGCRGRAAGLKIDKLLFYTNTQFEFEWRVYYAAQHFW